LIFSFIAGLLALKWLSHAGLKADAQKFFGFYCLIAAAGGKGSVPASVEKS
jgi:undecaprenyl pyrophosphate phosphatase UppP